MRQTLATISADADTLGDNTGPDDAYLGVTSSVRGRRWRPRGGDGRAALALAQRLGLPEIVARILVNRGIALDEAPGFLAPSLRDQMPDPACLKDMDKAAERLAGAILAGEPIAVFGDYDVDGATAAALLWHVITAVGGSCRIYVPDRQHEGYGPNAPALARLRREGAAVCVTVDCGIAAHEPLVAAAAEGLDVIVVDHHQAEAKLPPAVAIVNPNRMDDRSGLGHLAAVGVTFLLTVALNRALRRKGHFDATRAEPNLLGWLDLVALGTVCDVVPLTGLNRAFVAQGLKILARRHNPGLLALADVARLDSTPGAYHLGFLFGPRINAGGRVGAADLGARLLTTANPAEAASLARELDGLNRKRQEIEAAVLEAAQAQLAAKLAAGAGPVLVAVGDGWHPGVLGIVAGRLRERFDRPVFAIGVAGGVGKGSGRGMPGIDLGAAVIAARQSGLLINGGGHAMAAGITVAARDCAALERFLCARVGRQIGTAGLTPSLGLDGAVSLGAATPELLEVLGRLGPFGQGNPEPRFVLPGLRVGHSTVAGNGHVRCTVQDPGGRRLNAIAFRCAETPLGVALLGAVRGQGALTGRAVLLAGHLRLDSWNGHDKVQLVVEDAAPDERVVS